MFLLYNKVNQLYIVIYPLLFRFFSRYLLLMVACLFNLCILKEEIDDFEHTNVYYALKNSRFGLEYCGSLDE